MCGQVKCLECGTISEREEEFSDISIVVKVSMGGKNLSSLLSFVFYKIDWKGCKYTQIHGGKYEVTMLLYEGLLL